MRFTSVSKEWFNISTEEIEDDFKVPEDLHANPKRFRCYFFPQIHRFFIESSFGIANGEKFINDFLSPALKSQEELVLERQNAEEQLDRILGAQELHRLYMKITPSNDDPLGDIDKYMDNDMKLSEAKAVETTYHDSKDSKGIKKTPVIEALLKLVRRNGKAEATIKENGKTQKINTDKHPYFIKYSIPRKDPDFSKIGIELFDKYEGDEKKIKTDEGME